MERLNKTQRTRRLLLVLPILVLPFTTMMFWALGGGRNATKKSAPEISTGFNVHLPDGNVKTDAGRSKLDYYNQAAADSAKFREMVHNDPNYRSAEVPGQQHPGNSYGQTGGYSSGGLNSSVYGDRQYNDPNSQKIYGRLAELNQMLNSNGNRTGYGSSASSSYPGSSNYGYGNTGTTQGADVDRLEKMMNTMRQPAEEDPEMTQINGMLESILDIQHPDRVQEKIKKASQKNRGKVFTVQSPVNRELISTLENNSQVSDSNGFFGLANSVTDTMQYAVQAVVHEDQTVVSGSTVKLRLTSDIYVNGVRIPKDNFIFGTATLDGERLAIKVTDIRYGKSLFPVELTVCDMDGLDGVYIPGAITRDVAKESADRSLQSVGVQSIDPSWGAQAASAGIVAVKSLIGKKVKLVKVLVKAGYQVLLRDEKQKQLN